jgi:hypothetical protein
MTIRTKGTSKNVIPAKAGIQKRVKILVPCLCGSDKLVIIRGVQKGFRRSTLAGLLFFPKNFDDLWNEEGKDKEAYREENLEGK